MTGGGQPGGQNPPRCGQGLGRARVVSGPTLAPPTPPLRLFILLFGKTLGTREKIHEKFRSRRHRRNKIRGTEVSVPAPCRSGEVPPESIAIDFTAIFTAFADSHDEEGVVLPRG